MAADKYKRTKQFIKSKISNYVSIPLNQLNFAARLTDSFMSGICHRIRVGRAGARKHFWSQINN